jgi:hypothetical protein
MLADGDATGLFVGITRIGDRWDWDRRIAFGLWSSPLKVVHQLG